jgi:hypothetical protein
LHQEPVPRRRNIAAREHRAAGESASTLHRERNLSSALGCASSRESARLGVRFYAHADCRIRRDDFLDACGVRLGRCRGSQDAGASCERGTRDARRASIPGGNDHARAHNARDRNVPRETGEQTGQVAG